MRHDKKYGLLRDSTKEASDGTVLYQIRALRAVGDYVEKGDCGGYVESGDNLSHSGDAWIHDNAQVYGSARVTDNAQVFGDAKVAASVRVNKRTSIIWFSNVGSEWGTLTIATGSDGDTYVTRGCFSGTLLEFLEVVNNRHGDSSIGHEYRALIAVACSRLGIPTPPGIVPVGGQK